MAIGTPSYGNTEIIYHKNYKLKSPDASKGETVFVLPDLRILPPMHSLGEKGTWAKYYGQHFGYPGQGKEPGKPKQRPFACIQQTDFRTKMVTVPCSACDVIDEKSAERKAREAEYKTEGKSDDDICELLEPLTTWLKKHNCDRKWHINVVDRAGNFGVLQISHTLKKALDVKIDELRNKRKIDPIAVDGGVWFRFSRMGKFPVQDAVEYVMSESDDGSFRIERCPLTEAQCEQAEKICPDLATGVVKTISAAQINLLVACSGDPEEVDRIWALGTKAAPAPERSPVAKPVAKAPVVTEGDEIAKLKAQLAALEAQKAAAATKTEVAPTAYTGPTADDDDEMSDEEFQAKWGKNAAKQ